MKPTLALILVFLVCTAAFTQSIMNNLGLNGSFSVADTSNTFLTLQQSTGVLSLTKNLDLANTTSSSSGIISKGGFSFLHNYTAPGTSGLNTFVGYQAGNFTMSGSSLQASYNTSIGSFSLHANTTGSYNTAIGDFSLNNNNTGTNNTAIGHNSLLINSTGANNTAVGYNSLASNSSAPYNTALGSNALFNNNLGDGNTGAGNNCLYHNTSGTSNTGVGLSALFNNTTGGYNVAIGNYSLSSNTTAQYNTAVGYGSLSGNTTGYFNTTVGYNCGINITTGTNLTLIGFNSQASSPTANNEITLGNSGNTVLRCNATTITSLSDARDKKNIKDLSLGLDFLMKLKPRQFNWDKREWYDNNISDGSKTQGTPTAGFIAQELDTLQIKENAQWLNLVYKSNPDRIEASYGNLLPVIVKSVQELKAECDNLRNENTQLKSELASLNNVREQLAKMERVQNELLKSLSKDSEIKTVSSK